jgi:hypothetical protein
VDDVQVDGVHAEPPKAPFQLRDRICARGEELRRDEHLVAANAALAQPLADALLVAVRLRGIDVAVAELERPADGVHAFLSVRHLPDTEPEQRHPVAVGEHSRSSVWCHRT